MSVTAPARKSERFDPNKIASTIDIMRRQHAQKMRGRIDLASRYTFSIDKPGTRVIDDAFSIVRLKGMWRLDVHIADLATWCADDSVVDRIVQRSFAPSESHADRMILPHRLLHSAISLNAKKLRLATTVSMWFDVTGTRFATQVHRSQIRVNTNTDFDTVDAMSTDCGLCNTKRKRRVMERYNRLRTLSVRVAARQLAAGLLPVDHCDPRHWSSWHVVKTLMTETGFALADISRHYKSQVWYRIQAAPDQPNWRELREFFVQRLIELPYRPDARSLALAMDKMADDRVVLEAGRQLCLSKTPPAADSIVAKPHFSLGQRYYIQATSPLRRYRNLENQKAITKTMRDFGGPLCLAK